MFATGVDKPSIGALSMSIPLANSISDMKALACRRAVQYFAVDLGLHSSQSYLRRRFGDSSQDNIAALSSHGMELLWLWRIYILSLVLFHLFCLSILFMFLVVVILWRMPWLKKELVGCQVWSAQCRNAFFLGGF